MGCNDDDCLLQGGDHDDHHHHEPGMPFEFSYAVNEDDNNYNHNAISDGDVTRGEYRVALPDGRTQIVKYTADWKNGFNAEYRVALPDGRTQIVKYTADWKNVFNAEVTYEGEAKYPDAPAPKYGANAPAQTGQNYLPPQQGGGYVY
ncbi:unnamed protein product [Plutella xylostella]|uniref:(diamondback moth) hypothetical protein n=1 Tax=Plutella xylostella TaxID=51655 RepID=A0A8S4G0A2_PLUXY|nr:unnamed protein product [Plutella xylostella]